MSEIYQKNKQHHHQKTGSIEVVCGSMFSGKTEELIRRLNKAIIANLNVRIFKPVIDTRYSDDKIISHNRTSIHCLAIKNATEMLTSSGDADVIGIDEAQFFDNALIEIYNTLVNKGVRIIIAGLDMDFCGRPFGPIPFLCAIADEVLKTHTTCAHCGSLAYISHRLSSNKQQIVLGESSEYEPMCRKCYNKSLNYMSK